MNEVDLVSLGRFHGAGHDCSIYIIIQFCGRFPGERVGADTGRWVPKEQIETTNNAIIGKPQSNAQ